MNDLCSIYTVLLVISIHVSAEACAHVSDYLTLIVTDGEYNKIDR